MKIINGLSRISSIRNLLVVFVLFLMAICVVIVGAAVYTHKDPMPDKLVREAEKSRDSVVTEVTELYPVKVIDIISPHSIEEISNAVKKYDHIAIGGGRNSMGGQTASERAVQLDMRKYNKILSFSAEKKEITVQSGARWRDIQKYIDPSNLSVKIMQTYSNFTVGGSLSVNVHGRYVGLGPIILSVKKFNMVLADGSVIEASPNQNRDIFYSAIGGMGGIGVIAEVTLSLADNANVERSRVLVPSDQYWSFFSKNIRSNTRAVFHNGDIYPPDFDAVSAVSWNITDKNPTTPNRLIPEKKDYWLERLAWVIMSEWPGGRWIRRHVIDPIVYSGEAPVHTRNYEASYDIAELEPESRQNSSYVLQEYFVPVEHFDGWIPRMKKVFDDNDVNVINVSIRHALPDPGAKLAWAKKESFAFVVYYKQGADENARSHVAKWTRELIDQVLAVGGTYYLPYQPHATDDQFHRAYPGAVEYFEIKNKYDPSDKFTNKLWDKYYSKEKLQYYKDKQELLRLTASIGEYIRPFDNAYLSLPEWYIVYAADEYAAVLETGIPSDFDYFQSISDYWKQHHLVVDLTKNSTHNNDDYKTVLSVIGWSFSIESFIKGIYENTVGRASEIVAGNMPVAEDKYAAKVARDYAVFIYDHPWYDFPYFSYLKGLWHLDDRVDYSIGQNVRRMERKLILTVEYGIKTLYSKAIAYATHTKFGVQDDIVYAIVTRDSGQSREIISALHYQPFTRLLIKTMEAERNNPNFSILDISGNNKITFCYLDETNSPVVGGAREVVRDVEVRRMKDRNKELMDRVTAEVDVRNLLSVYKSLYQRGVAIEHFYDY